MYTYFAVSCIVRWINGIWKDIHDLFTNTLQIIDIKSVNLDVIPCEHVLL